MTPTPSGVRASTLAAIGETPVVRLGLLAPVESAEVLVKLEYHNPTGSYKDRMALAMIDGAEARGDLTPGKSVVEFTGGSTGSSSAFVRAVKGYPLKLVSSDALSPEKPRTMRAFGADLTIVPSVGGAVTPDLFVRMRERVQEIVAAAPRLAAEVGLGRVVATVACDTGSKCLAGDLSGGVNE